MDSLSQLVLGAAVGKFIAGKKMGNKAALWGAIAGTLPDMDVVLSPWLDVIQKIIVHRSYSHAVFFHFLMAFLLAWISVKLSKKSNYSFKLWWHLWFWGMFTHALLDCCTAYGTQLFQPFTNYLVSFNNVSIIDPLYTMPFLLFLVISLFFKKENPNFSRFNNIGLIISTGYLLFTFGVKCYVESIFKSNYEKQGMVIDHLITSPTFFNSVLWYHVASNESTIYVGEYSLLDQTKDIDFVKIQRNLDQINKHPAKYEIEVLKWFGTDYYFANQTADTLEFYNAKFGRANLLNRPNQSSFPFYYKITQEQGKSVVSVIQPENLEDIKTAFGDLWQRLLGLKN